MVVDVAGSHRDIIESLAVEESDSESDSTSGPKPSVVLQAPDVEITKSSPQKLFSYVLYFMIIFHIL